MLQHFSIKRGKLVRNANIFMAMALVASPAQAQTVPDLPANPLKAIDGEWYGVDHKIKLSVANGVVTIVENDTEANRQKNRRVEVRRPMPRIDRHLAVRHDRVPWSRFRAVGGLRRQAWTEDQFLDRRFSSQEQYSGVSMAISEVTGERAEQ